MAFWQVGIVSLAKALKTGRGCSFFAARVSSLLPLPFYGKLKNSRLGEGFERGRFDIDHPADMHSSRRGGLHIQYCPILSLRDFISLRLKVRTLHPRMEQPVPSPSLVPASHRADPDRHRHEESTHRQH
jgi:hypothetical protein